MGVEDVEYHAPQLSDHVGVDGGRKTTVERPQVIVKVTNAGVCRLKSTRTHNIKIRTAFFRREKKCGSVGLSLEFPALSS